MRSGNRVGFHRPRLSPDELQSLPFSEAEKLQNEIFAITKDYLLEMGFSDAIATNMLTTSSKEIYFLDQNELNTIKFDPDVEEWLLAKCPAPLSKQQMERYIALRKIKRSAIENELFQLLSQQLLESGACTFKALLELRKERQSDQ